MTRRKLNNWNRIVLALGLMLLAETLAAAQTLQRVVITYPSRSIGSIHSFIALERGFFREEGLDAQLVQVRGTAAVAATVSGDAHALEAMGTAMGAIQRGLPLRILAVSLYRPCSGWSLVPSSKRPMISTEESWEPRPLAGCNI
jgi:ABC-type nitrate/sulfonate/bicarbonate transport system substrate-binding protein